MPHAMTDAFMADEAPAEAAAPTPAHAANAARQQESETPNERAMRAATAARRELKLGHRQQG